MEDITDKIAANQHAQEAEDYKLENLKKYASYSQEVFSEASTRKNAGSDSWKKQLILSGMGVMLFLPIVKDFALLVKRLNVSGPLYRANLIR
jgi:hypothetical protein